MTGYSIRYDYAAVVLDLILARVYDTCYLSGFLSGQGSETDTISSALRNQNFVDTIRYAGISRWIEEWFSVC